MPTLSVSDSHLTVERTQNLEIGYERVAGSRTYSVGAYDEIGFERGVHALGAG